MFHLNAFSQPTRNWLIAGRRSRCRVILKPRKAPRPVHPEPAQKSELANGRPDVRGKPRARSQNKKDLTRRGVKPGRYEHNCANIRRTENRPGPGVPERGSPASR